MLKGQDSKANRTRSKKLKDKIQKLKGQDQKS